jgi:hypothetical protein
MRAEHVAGGLFCLASAALTAVAGWLVFEDWRMSRR